MKIVIEVDEYLNSTLSIGTDEFPVQIFHDDLENFENGFVNWHKQKQVEISLVLEGSVLLCEPENEIEVKKGEGFIVLPNRLHSVKPNSVQAAKYITIIFEPVFICGFNGSFFEKSYYSHLINNGYSILKIKDEELYKQTVFPDLLWISERNIDKNSETMLEIQHRLQKLWICIVNNICLKKCSAITKLQDVRINQMLEYLHINYRAKFSLDDMAKCHNISRGECCRFFKKMMNMKMSEYLTEFRLKKSLYLLENTEMNITEITNDVGFSCSSYFISTFKKKMGCSPLKYRKHFKNT